MSILISSSESSVILSSPAAEVHFDLLAGTYTVTTCRENGLRELLLSRAESRLNNVLSSMPGMLWKWEEGHVDETFGRGVCIRLRGESGNPRLPAMLLEFALLEEESFVAVRMGVDNTTEHDLHVKGMTPVLAHLFEAQGVWEPVIWLGGDSADHETKIRRGNNGVTTNNMLLTATRNGEVDRCCVFGGLKNLAFLKHVGFRTHDTLKTFVVQVRADDPVGRQVEAGTSWLSDDWFYLGAVGNDPFQALEAYGEILAKSHRVQLGAIDYPIINLWYTHTPRWGNGPFRNNTPGVMWTIEDAATSGLLRYGPVGVRLEQDDYAEPNNQQGWWDDEHWQKYESGQLLPPYETTEAWCRELIRRGGEPFVYCQTAKRSEDYAVAHPGHMLFNESHAVRQQGGMGWWNGGKGELYWGYDFTDPGFREHMASVYANLKQAGVKGIKFDYPYTATHTDGGFEDCHATAASSYRCIYELARDGLGSEADVHERLAQYGDVTFGVANTQRIMGDCDWRSPAIVEKAALRWYKNRVCVHYDLDVVNTGRSFPLDTPDGWRATLTMAFVTSARLELGMHPGSITPEQVADLSRVIPLLLGPRSPRPIDMLLGKPYPQIFDLPLSDDWHQVVLFNTASEKGFWYRHDTRTADSLLPSTVELPLSTSNIKGGLGLDPASHYHIYDFWNDCYYGAVVGATVLQEQLRPGEARMLSVRKQTPHPQVIATRRHVLQGALDMPECRWTGEALCGRCLVVGGERYEFVVALNGDVEVSVTAENAAATVRPGRAAGLVEVVLVAETSMSVCWSLRVKRHSE